MDVWPSVYKKYKVYCFYEISFYISLSIYSCLFLSIPLSLSISLFLFLSFFLSFPFIPFFSLFYVQNILIFLIQTFMTITNRINCLVILNCSTCAIPSKNVLIFLQAKTHIKSFKKLTRLHTCKLKTLGTLTKFVSKLFNQ